MKILSWFRSCGLVPQSHLVVASVATPALLVDVPHAGEPTISEAHPGQVATVSGRLFDVLNPRPEEIEIREIAHALSQLNRFAGHTRYPYSVAQHLVNCADECEARYPGEPKLAFACLLHDCAEAYCCDVIRPIKRLIRRQYQPIEDRVQDAVWRKWLPEYHSEFFMQGVVKEIDNAVVMTESRELMVGSENWSWGDTVPAQIRIRQLTPLGAKRIYLRRFDQLQELI